MHGVKLRHFDQYICNGWKLAIHKFKIARRSQKGCTVADWIVPARSIGKTQRRKKTRQPLVDFTAADRAQKGDPFNHALILPWQAHGLRRCGPFQHSPLIVRCDEDRKRPAYDLAVRSVVAYVVERGFTAIAVAGTGADCGVVIVQSGSDPGAQAGRLGLICCVSVSVVVLM